MNFRFDINKFIVDIPYKTREWIEKCQDDLSKLSIGCISVDMPWICGSERKGDVILTRRVMICHPDGAFFMRRFFLI